MRSIVLFLLITCQTFAQYKFSGKVNAPYFNAKVYLLKVDDYSKSNLFLTDNILQEEAIDSVGNFTFKGNFLPKENRFYKISVDSCNSDVTDYNHLITPCDASNSILFIANNNDSIYFPLNNFNQSFCSIEYSRVQNIAIQKIDSIQEFLLHDLSETKSNEQRKIIFKNYLKEIQAYSKSLNEPLAELYSYHLYANRNSFGRSYYLEDIKTSNYYKLFTNRLEQSYPNSDYVKQLKKDITGDYPTKEKRNYTLIFLTCILISLGFNFYFITNKLKNKTTILNYQEILSPQEQKVFELMGNKKTNKDIANELFISLSTVKTHINSIYSKLNISSRNEVSRFFE